MGTWWAVTNNACMGHHDWVSKEVNETDEVQWVERDTMDKTGTQHGPALTTQFARRAAIPGNLSVQECAFLNGTDFGLPPPRASFQSPHLPQNTCHETSDFCIIIMIIVYVL